MPKPGRKGRKDEHLREYNKTHDPMEGNRKRSICPSCGQVFATEEKYREHWKEVHTPKRLEGENT